MKNLRRNFERFCLRNRNKGIRNLMLYICIGNAVVYLLSMFAQNYFLYYLLCFDRASILKGQIWRLFTFVLVPFSGGGPLSVVLGIYFTWFVGSALEREWGDFRFNLYVLLGMAGAWLACLLTGSADTYCLSLSLLLAFAMLYPELQVLLFFVIPLKVKYFGIFAAALWVFSFLSMGMLGKLNYLLCMLGFLLFFGPQAWHNIRAWVRREQWKRKNRR